MSNSMLVHGHADDAKQGLFGRNKLTPRKNSLKKNQHNNSSQQQQQPSWTVSSTAQWKYPLDLVVENVNQLQQLENFLSQKVLPSLQASHAILSPLYQESMLRHVVLPHYASHHCFTTPHFILHHTSLPRLTTTPHHHTSPPHLTTTPHHHTSPPHLTTTPHHHTSPPHLTPHFTTTPHHHSTLR